jgi:short-subunit dehydrogenase
LQAENVNKNIRVSLIIPGRIKTGISINAIDRYGKPHSKIDEGQDKGMPAEESAKIICRKLKKEKKEILVGGKEIIMVHIRRFLPALYYKLAPKIKPL